MFNKKLKMSKEDLIELTKRIELINQYVAVVQALEFQKGAWLAQKFIRYGLDSTKNYNVELKTGVITEIKSPTKKEVNK